MKKNIFVNAALSVIALGALTNCAGDYLDTYPTMSVTSATVTQSTDDVRRGMWGVCAGMYNQYQDLQQFVTGEDLFMIYGELPSQDYISTTFYNSGWDVILNMQVLDNNSYITSSYLWNYCYTLINQANDILCNMGDQTEGPQADKDFLRASLLTLRAHGYWRLLQAYAPRWQDSDNGNAKTVVLRLDNSIGEAPLATMNEVLDQMYADLDEAIELFKKSGLKRTFKWEPDLSVAYGTYARLALLKNDWQKAYDMSMNVINLGQYSLMSQQEVLGGFADANNEWMWGAIDREPLYYFSFALWYGCNGYYCYAQGYGAGAINIDLYDQIPDTDVRKQWWMAYGNGCPITKEQWYNVKTNYVDDYYVAVKDSKMNARVKRNMVNYLSDINPNPAVFGNAYSIPASADVEAPDTQYPFGGQLKFYAKGQGSVAVNQGDVPFMREAEFYLTAAEAAAELGKTGDAQKLLNDLNKKRDTAYNCTASGQALIDEARMYRRVELWGEGFNWFDFKRWNLPITRRAWKAGDVTSGNWPAGIAKDIPTDACGGWVVAIPRGETEYNHEINK